MNTLICSRFATFTTLPVYCNIAEERLEHIKKKCEFKKNSLGHIHSFRFFMKFHCNCSASGMYVFNSVPSFMEMWRTSIYGFTQCLLNSDNAIVSAAVSAGRISSNFWKGWACILYMASQSY